MTDLEGRRDLRQEMAPTGIGPSGFIPSSEGEFESATHAEPVARSQWALFRRRFFQHKVAIASIFVLLFLVVICFGASFFAPFSRTDQDLLLGPVSPQASHWLGTDELGRDELSRLLYAGQISLKIGFAVAIISTVVGTAVGALAGYFGKATDQVLMRVTDLFLILPGIAILAIALKLFGQTDPVIILVLAFLFWMYVARIVRGEVLSLKEKEFIEAARASGASSNRIIIRHIIPNIMGSIMVNTTLSVAGAIITESTLSFLGFGVQPPQASWGSMLDEAQGYVGTSKAYLIYAPALMIVITILAVNFIGDGLRDAFDPQSEKH
ncbi:MAG: ABC transporter permease [Acidimicrobiia bacterium]